MLLLILCIVKMSSAYQDCCIIIFNTFIMEANIMNHDQSAPKTGLISDHIACYITYQSTSADDKETAFIVNVLKGLILRIKK